jgi:hypothetical protein
MASMAGLLTNVQTIKSVCSNRPPRVPQGDAVAFCFLLALIETGFSSKVSQPFSGGLIPDINHNTAISLKL